LDQCGAPTAEQEAKAADDQARLKQEEAVYASKGLYGTPDGPGPQYGEGGGDRQAQLRPSSRFFIGSTRMLLRSRE